MRRKKDKTPVIVTVAIMCYGLFGIEYHRTSEEMKGLRQYFEHCANYIVSLHKKGTLSGVVLCGGITNPEFHPGISEAATSAEYFRELLATKGLPVKEINICLEETSFNTAQNIVFTSYMLTGIRLPFRAEEFVNATEEKREKMIQDEKCWQALSHNLVFICDKHRWFKTRVMISIVEKSKMFPQLQFRVVSFPRQDIHPNSRWSKQLMAAALYWWDPAKFFTDLKVGQE